MLKFYFEIHSNNYLYIFLQFLYAHNNIDIWLGNQFRIYAMMITALKLWWRQAAVLFCSQPGYPFILPRKICQYLFFDVVVVMFELKCGRDFYAVVENGFMKILHTFYIRDGDAHKSTHIYHRTAQQKATIWSALMGVRINIKWKKDTLLLPMSTWIRKSIEK